MQVSKSTMFTTLTALALICSAGCGGGGEVPAPSSDDGTPSTSSTTKQTELPLATENPGEEWEGEPTEGEEWGDLRLQFVYGGVPTAPAPIAITKDTEYCSMKAPVHETLLVDPATKGIANVMVSVYLGRGDKIEIHPDYEKKKSEPLKMTNLYCRFEPHAAFLRAGQPLVIANDDTVQHNVKAEFSSSDNRAFNQTVDAKGEITRDGLTDAIREPTKISCSMHPWMTSYLMIQDHPYGGFTGKTGRIELKGLPVGEHTLQVWHENASGLDTFEIDGSDVTWRKGRIKVNIKPGVNYAPIITIPSAQISK